MSPSLLCRIWTLLLGASGAVGCALSPEPAADRLTLTSLGGESLDQLPLVPRLALRGSRRMHPSDLWLVRGRASEKELDQILAAAPSDQLAEKRIPLSVWISAGALFLAPLVVLEPGQDYSLVALSFGALARVTTAATPSPIWWRWGAGPIPAGGWVVHCALPPPWTIEQLDPPLNAVDFGAGALGQRTLEPTGVEVEILAGFSDIVPAGTCVRFRAPERAGAVLPPQEISGRFFEPSPILIAETPAATEGASPEIHVVGSAAFLDLPPAVAEFSLSPVGGGKVGGTLQLFHVETVASSSLLLGQFERGAYTLSLSTIDAQGGVGTHSLGFEIAEQRGHLVLTEVLANPLGPEPESEWVEVVNIGRAAVSLDGYRLEDSGGVTLLPAVTLPQGGVGLLVRADFVAGSGGDVVPAVDAIPIVVEELGEGGLSNSGENLRLLAPDGRVVSEIPAGPAGPGQSLARRHLLAPDWPTSFGRHAEPGASPGSANIVE